MLSIAMILKNVQMLKGMIAVFYCKRDYYLALQATICTVLLMHLVYSPKFWKS